MDDEPTEDERLDALNANAPGTTPRASGIRFYRSGDGFDEGDEDEANEAEPFPDADADELARSVGKIVGKDAAWRGLPVGGAGDNGAVELVVHAGQAFALLHFLLKTPGAAKEAWEHIKLFLDRKKAARWAWESSADIAVTHCLAIIQEEWPKAYTTPLAVKVVEDGVFAAMFGDRPRGVHVIVISRAT
jgi:hypothetical protein